MINTFEFLKYFLIGHFIWRPKKKKKKTFPAPRTFHSLGGTELEFVSSNVDD